MKSTAIMIVATMILFNNEIISLISILALLAIGCAYVCNGLEKGGFKW